MDCPVRKHPRLKAYDYSSNGAYFVTICTKDRICLFKDAVGRDPCVPPSKGFEIAEYWITKISSKFPGINLDNHVIMPNHAHLLLLFDRHETAAHAGAALHEVVQWYKTMTTNSFIQEVKAGKLPRFNRAIWQTSFHDHIIRDENDYLNHWQYIDNNPAKWAEDEYFIDY